MEDAHITYPDLSLTKELQLPDEVAKRSSVFGVFDGHGGTQSL